MKVDDFLRLPCFRALLEAKEIIYEPLSEFPNSQHQYSCRIAHIEYRAFKKLTHKELVEFLSSVCKERCKYLLDIELPECCEVTAYNLEEKHSKVLFEACKTWYQLGAEQERNRVKNILGLEGK